MRTKIAIVSLGCSKNLIDSELMLGILGQHNFEITENMNDAGIIIVNTCGFIGDAKEESIDTILEVAEYKEIGLCHTLIVAGCLSQRYKEVLIEEIPEIDGIIGTGNVHDIVQAIEECNRGRKPIKVDSINSSYIENVERVLQNHSHSAYIKIAEGCDNYCTYCIIPQLRGQFRSRTMESIINEAHTLVKNGAKEIILIAQDTSKYGTDLYGEYKLPELLNKLNNISDLKWIRLLYLYPETFSDELINSIRNNEKVVKYVDIPVQHASNSILKRMNRKTKEEEIRNLIERLRSEIKGIVIRTTLIVGFPGETEQDFNILYNFVKDMKFDRLGVFKYSKEEGTAAAKMSNQVLDAEKAERLNEIMLLQQEIASNMNKQRVGKEYAVIVDEYLEENLYIGRTYMDSPEIDGIVYVESSKRLYVGDMVNVKITSYYDYDLRGNFINELS